MSTPLGSSQFFVTERVEEGQSLRFEDGDSASLSFTPASTGNTQTFTISLWLKRANLTAGYILRASEFYLYYTSDNALNYYDYRSGADGVILKTNAVYRDASAWYHIVLASDRTQSTAADRVKLYVNNEQITSFATETYPTTSEDSYFNNSANTHYLGGTTSNYFDGYIANFAFIDGQQLDPTSFGKYDGTLWKPKSDADIQSLTFGTNGFFLNFSDSADIGADTSGNGNDWTPTNLASTDVVLDGPYNGGNFCVVNPLTKSSGGALQQGNLLIPFGGTYPSTVMGSMGVSSGKWYWEIRFTGGAYNNGHAAGIATPEMANRNIDPYATTNPYNHYYDSRGYFYNSGTNTSASTFAPNDIIGFALDIDNDEISYYKNGTLVGSAQSIETGQTWMPFHKNSSFTALTQRANFGQDSSFNGTVTPQGNTDDNGLGDFYYAPPSGYLALNTANMPTPTITAPDEYFNTVLWTGDGTSSRGITGVGFQADFNWVKSRSSTAAHLLHDSVRGSDADGLIPLTSQSTAAESTFDATWHSNFGSLDSLDSDGFTVTDGSLAGGYNTSGTSYVAWNWLAGGTAVSNTDGSITSQVSANPTAGFSIVSYTGGGSAGDTVGHGLSSAPEMIIVKDRGVSNNWPVYHAYNTSAPETDSLFLNKADATLDLPYWNDTAPSASVFTLGVNLIVNDSGHNFIAYCFHSVEGYSKIGTYESNNSTNGPFVYCGFRPAWILMKDADRNSMTWVMFDNKRGPINPNDESLAANSASAEPYDSASDIDFLSNGFKLRGGSSSWNNYQTETYIFVAFAEDPFKYANAK